MHLRINDVIVPKSEIDELGEVLANKALPVVAAEEGYRGLMYVADRTSGNCAIVSMWDTREAMDASEHAIASIRKAVLEAVTGTLNALIIADVMREVRTVDSQVGNRTRAVRVTARPGSADALLAFYDEEAVPRLQGQPGFLNARLIRDLDHDGKFIAVSHWENADALEDSEAISASLREKVASAVSGATVERVTTSKILLLERRN